MDAEQTSYGPFIIGSAISGREAVTMSMATLFLPDGSSQTVALRRTRVCDDGAHDAFLRAAERYAVLRHPHIVPVRDLGTIDGRSYLATEYVRGHNLLRVLARCGQKRLGFPTDVALFIVQRVLSALEYAHALRDPQGRPLLLAHGDLCHSNVLLTVDGQVQVSDFGLGTFSTRRRTPRRLNAGVGKRFSSYLAPEQVRGEPADAAADIFAVGVLLFELVSGHILFTGTDEDVLLERLAAGKYEVPLERYRPDLHPMLAWIVRTALAPEPEERFSSAASFSRAIDELLSRVNARLDRYFLNNLMQRLFGAKALEETA